MVEPEEITRIHEALVRVEQKLDEQADLKWRVIAHEVVAGAVVALLGLALALAALWPSGSK